jgi:hypothetical protein
MPKHMLIGMIAQFFAPRPLSPQRTTLCVSWVVTLAGHGFLVQKRLSLFRAAILLNLGFPLAGMREGDPNISIQSRPRYHEPQSQRLQPPAALC